MYNLARDRMIDKVDLSPEVLKKENYLVFDKLEILLDQREVENK